MTLVQYMRHKRFKDVRIELKILDNTSDELIEVSYGIPAFITRDGKVRLINIDTLMKINTEPMEIAGIIDSNIIVLVYQNIAELNSARSLVVDIDKYIEIMNVDFALEVCHRLIYTAPVGIVSKELETFSIYNTNGKEVYRTKVGFNRTFQNILNTNLYILQYSYIVGYTEHEFKSKFIEYDELTQTCREIAVIDGRLELKKISNEACLVRKIVGKQDLKSNIINFKQIDYGNDNELDKLIYL